LFRTSFDKNSKEQKTLIFNFQKIFFLNNLKNTIRSFLLQARQNKTKFKIEITRLFFVNEINLFLKSKIKLLFTNRLLLVSETKLLFTSELLLVSETKLLLKSRIKLLFANELFLVSN